MLQDEAVLFSLGYLQPVQQVLLDLTVDCPLGLESTEFLALVYGCLAHLRDFVEELAFLLGDHVGFTKRNGGLCVSSGNLP